MSPILACSRCATAPVPEGRGAGAARLSARAALRASFALVQGARDRLEVCGEQEGCGRRSCRNLGGRYGMQYTQR
jgi:hypothetical protein